MDNIHSSIEKALKVCEVYSPSGFVKVLTKVRQSFMKVIELKTGNFVIIRRPVKILNFQKFSSKSKGY